MVQLLAPSRYALYPAVLSEAMILVTRKWLCAYLVSWAGGAYALLSVQLPPWYHHQLPATVPAAMFATGGPGEIWPHGTGSPHGGPAGPT
jgi:hypothetical protein